MAASSTPVLTMLFQSSLELSPECNSGQTGMDRVFQLVSILTRAFARVQQPSSPFAIAFTASFNPHSSFRPSATLSPDPGCRRVARVSILTRAFARVQRPHSSVRAGRGSRGRLREPPQKSFRRRVGEGGGKAGFQCPLASFSACANPPGFWHLLGVRAKQVPGWLRPPVDRQNQCTCPDRARANNARDHRAGCRCAGCLCPGRSL